MRLRELERLLADLKRQAAEAEASKAEPEGLRKSPSAGKNIATRMAETQTAIDRAKLEAQLDETIAEVRGELDRAVQLMRKKAGLQKEATRTDDLVCEVAAAEAEHASERYYAQRGAAYQRSVSVFNRAISLVAFGWIVALADTAWFIELNPKKTKSAASIDQHRQREFDGRVGVQFRLKWL